jgi:dolichol-phosphate mannosyltransferase
VNDVLVVIPTYNEIHNLGAVIDRILVSVDGADILIVDDNSPDGTGRLADELAAANERISVLHRRVKSGLGDAYRAGFAWGLQRGYAYLVEMDGDGSHQPEQLPALLAVVTREHNAADVALGSRWIRGGSAPHWAFRRRLLSRAGSLYARVALGLRQRDVTGGYRVFSAGALRAIDYASVESQGYCFQIEMLWRSNETGMRVVEVPIEFVERASGVSKMSSAIVLEAITRTTQWGISALPNRFHRAGQTRSGSLSTDVTFAEEPLRGRAAVTHRVDGRD